MVKAVVSAVAAIDEEAWRPIAYTLDGEAQVAECTARRIALTSVAAEGALIMWRVEASAEPIMEVGEELLQRLVENR